METLTTEQILLSRREALKLSRDLNPDKKSDNSGTQLAGYYSSTNPPTVSKILDDAEIIYNWLTKVL